MKYLLLTISISLLGCGSNEIEDYVTKDFTTDVAAVITLAIIQPDGDDRSPNPRPEPECPCNGTGQIRHGDGHITKCPCDNCTCGSGDMPTEAPQINQDAVEATQTTEESSNDPESGTSDSGASDDMVTIQPVTESKPRTRLLVFSATWCGPCQVLKAELNALKNNGWNVDVSDTATIQIIDFDQHQDIAQKYGVTSLPTTVRLVDDSVTHSRTGAMDRWQIDNFYREGN